MDWAGVRDIMATPLILDGRRLLDPETMRALGFHYERVGSPPSGAAVPVSRTIATARDEDHSSDPGVVQHRLEMRKVDGGVSRSIRDDPGQVAAGSIDDPLIRERPHA